MLKINELARLYLGVKDENESLTIEIDMSAWAQRYPNATAEILHKRNGDQTKYVTGATYNSETKILSWTPTEYDTFYEGFGIAEIRMVESEIVKKTKDLLVTAVSPSVIDGTGTVTASNYQAWLDAAIAEKQAAVAAKVDAQTAQAAAEDAQEAAENAQAAAEAAVTNSPYIDSTTGNWFVWDWDDDEYKNTGVHAEGPKGDQGERGERGYSGQAGQDGVSPSVSVTDVTGGHQVTITDAEGSHAFVVTDGEDGQDGNTPVLAGSKSGKTSTITADGVVIATILDGNDGTNGQDGAPGAQGEPGEAGYSPTAGVTKIGKVATITITDKNGTTTAAVTDGADADPTELIDDTAGEGDTDVVWSADKSATELEGKVDEPASDGTDGQVLATDGSGGRYWITVQGGGGGTSDYNELSNKPQIGGTTLSGNKSLADLGIAAAVDLSGKYSKPSSGIPKTDLENAVQTSLGKADSAYQKPSGGIPASDLASGVIPDVSGLYTKPSGGIPNTDLASAVQTSLDKADSAYQKPSGGITSSDLASAVQTSLGKADTAYQKPSGGITSSDLASAVQTSLGKADTAYQKPSGGIPASDIASGVIPDISGKIDKPVSPTAGQFLSWNGSAWVAATLPLYNGGVS